MCGIVAVLGRPSTVPTPLPADILMALEQVAEELNQGGSLDIQAAALQSAAGALAGVDARLRGTSGLACLLTPGTAAKVDALVESITTRIRGFEARLDQDSADLPPSRHEEVNAGLGTFLDHLWSVGRDRLGMAAAVSDLLGYRPVSEVTNLDGWWAIQVALSSLDRLEVRGRDSAGLHVLVSDHGLDLSGPEAGADMERALLERGGDPLYPGGSVRFRGGQLSFVYKAAAEIGELGDNGRALRRAIKADELLIRAIEAPGARVTVLGHTRWASVGIISEPNAHPVNSEETGGRLGPYVVAALNGDVDNHMDLRQAENLAIAPEVTTDAKIIPAIVSRRLAEGLGMDEAFRATVPRFEGSVAIAASSAATPDQLHLALSGSGQSLYIGLAGDAFVVASEPYGLVEETSRYVRMDGERSRGEAVTLDRSGAGTITGITRVRYSGGAAPVGDEDVVTAEIRTRDVDRRGFDHFLLKELTEAPASFRKTLRGRIVAGPDGRLMARLGPDSIPPAVADAVRAGAIRRVFVIGQGTAAVAGQAVATALASCLPANVAVTAMPATELSGFGLSDDMGDTLVVAISQSGTTTDTNRTVDLVRTRGAHVLAVVNRRNSDLVTKAHGVLHTSDGRDVEMSVASTKAFYAQVAAGWLLAAALGRLSAGPGAAEPGDVDRVLTALRDLPEKMESVLGLREEISRVAAAVVPRRRYWAVVGSGPDRVAAAEVRIKLSELCYRSISSDATEDKKHIDLSCEPLIIVCAAGLRGPTAGDVAKEVAIYQAHKAAPVVIVTDSEAGRFGPSAEVISVPETDPAVGFVLSAMVGHLFGYEAALSIDAQARPLRAARAAIERAVASGRYDLLERLAPEMERATEPFLRGLRDGSYNGNLEAATAVRLVSLLRYSTGALPLEGYEAETGKIGTPGALLTDLLDALNRGIDELTRPIDAIKHQAKTVTVGISRSEDALLGIPLVKATLAAGPALDTLGYRALRTLGALDSAVAEVLGFTRYRFDWSDHLGATVSVVDQGGIALGIRSRTERDPRLLGSKHRAADEREVTVVRGASDGRTVVLVPEVKGQQVTGMTLLHVRWHDFLPAEKVRAVLTGYRTRYSALADAVTETEPMFDDSRLGSEPVVELLTEPVYQLAKRWRRPAS